ncbi:MAG: helicase-related protein, partial [Candidatus Poribacteria bacterium]
VWDLLKVLGLGGRWGAIQDNFLNFFAELREPFFDVNWEFVFNMVQDFLELGGTLDELFCEHAQRQLGLVEWQQIQSLPYSNKRKSILKMLESQSRAFVVEFAKRHTPLRQYLFRNTRSLLREYQSRGILSARVPKRAPVLEWIPMRYEEKKLYDRIEEYISDFYEKYESERKGLGFVMTVYRRRLTSSFYAMERSLERRLAYLAGEPEKDTIAGLADDDLEQDELQADVDEELEIERRELFSGEIEYIQDFLTDLRHLSGDSKLEKLLSDLREIFKKRETVLIFTQYTDTMDYLREQLRHVYGNQVACYSSRGGEYWDGGRWVRTTKEQIKNAFRARMRIKILLGTEAASEGLNLQTCGVLINYDMPWNPMRVEQRIGRIDRIGQEHEVVWIRNYFYADTVEATVYQRLSDRIGWFEEVVGELQPILSQVARTIQTVAMMRKEERVHRLETEIETLRQELDTKAVESLRLDDYLDTTIGQQEAEAPITLQQLESLMVTSRSLGSFFRPHPSFAGAHLLRWNEEEYAVTFDQALFDQHPNSLRLLSFGDELFDELLECVEHTDASSEQMGILRCSTEAPARLVAYYTIQEGCRRRIETYNDLQAILESDASFNWSDEMIAKAREDFLSQVKAARENVIQVEDYREKSHRLALEEEGRQILLRAAFIELAMAQQVGLFGDAVSLTFNEDAVKALRRHKYPFAGLLKLVDTEGLRPTPTHPFYLKIQGASVESLSQRFRNIREQAAALLDQLANLKADSTVETTKPLCEITTTVIKYPRIEKNRRE